MDYSSEQVKSISRILFKYDPAQLKNMVPDDEYDPEADAILLGLKNVKTVAEVEELCKKVILKWFSQFVLEDCMDSIPDMSREIWLFWIQTNQKNSPKL